ncbi:hypothetical protein [Methylobacterium sp. Leaf361]|uniref:hypothetical protein n=1 Tax=Methylobacterium sp. Leaf361 TaxID=1736352 RepID=UPI0012FE8BF3|nr:hypothetical protein [Methylobacterium sp. Leaf361]
MTGAQIFARKVDATGRSTSQPASSKDRKRNRPPEGPWVWFTSEMMESPAWRAMSLNARLVVDRITVEHMAHAGTQNGALPVTFDDFERFGIRRGSIAAAIQEAAAIGFVDIAEQGTRGWGAFKGRATRFRLAWLPTAAGDPETTRWRRFTNLKEAQRIASQARQSGDTRRASKKALPVTQPMRVAAE